MDDFGLNTVDEVLQSTSGVYTKKLQAMPWICMSRRLKVCLAAAMSLRCHVASLLAMTV
jgi:hypothetical protein